MKNPIQIEMTEEIHENAKVLKVIFFVGARDVEMFRYDNIHTATNAIKQFYQEYGWK